MDAVKVRLERAKEIQEHATKAVDVGYELLHRERRMQSKMESQCLHSIRNARRMESVETFVRVIADKESAKLTMAQEEYQREAHEAVEAVRIYQREAAEANEAEQKNRELAAHARRVHRDAIKGILAVRELDRQADEQAVAAIQIQAFYRGYLERRRLNRKKAEEQSCVVKVQDQVEIVAAKTAAISALRHDIIGVKETFVKGTAMREVKLAHLRQQQMSLQRELDAELRKLEDLQEQEEAAHEVVRQMQEKSTRSAIVDRLREQVALTSTRRTRRFSSSPGAQSRRLTMSQRTRTKSAVSTAASMRVLSTRMLRTNKHLSKIISRCNEALEAQSPNGPKSIDYKEVLAGFSMFQGATHGIKAS